MTNSCFRLNNCLILSIVVLILVNKKSRALSGPPRVHSGLVIFRRKCTQMFFWEQLLLGEVAQAICKCQLLTRFMCGWKSTSVVSPCSADDGASSLGGDGALPAGGGPLRALWAPIIADLPAIFPTG